MNGIKGITTGLAIAALALAGCGGDEGGNEAKAGAKPAANNARAVQYAQCMRKNGVPAYPEPDPNGRFLMRAEKGGALDPESPQFKAAQQACKALQPPGMGSNKGNSEVQKQMMKFAACMRKNGVPKFPDPENGMLKMTPESGIDTKSPQFKSAQEACRKLAPRGMVPGDR